MKQTRKRIGILLLILIALFMYPLPAQAQEKAHFLGNSFTNQILGSRTCEYGGRIYYGYRDRIYSIKKDGTGKKTVFQMEDDQGYNGFSQIAVYGNYIYAIFDFYWDDEPGNQQLLRIKRDGSSYRNYGNAAGFSIADDRIYYTKEVERTTKEGVSYMEPLGIYVMNLDGTKSTSLIKDAYSHLLAVDGTYIYYRHYNLKTNQTELYRCNMKGKNRTRLLAKTALSAISGNYVYYTRQTYHSSANGDQDRVTTIYRKNIKDRSIKKIYTYKGCIQNFCVDGKNLYLSSYEKGLIRVNISTGKAKTVNRHEGMGIRGIHGNVIIFDQWRSDEKNDSNIDIVLANLTTGKKIKKIGAYFVL